jgi:hypothetical protein
MSVTQSVVTTTMNPLSWQADINIQQDKELAEILRDIAPILYLIDDTPETINTKQNTHKTDDTATVIQDDKEDALMPYNEPNKHNTTQSEASRDVWKSHFLETFDEVSYFWSYPIELLCNVLLDSPMVDSEACI